MSLATTSLQSLMEQARRTPAYLFDCSYFVDAIDAVKKHFDADPELVKDAEELVHELRRRNPP